MTDQRVMRCSNNCWVNTGRNITVRHHNIFQRKAKPAMPANRPAPPDSSALLWHRLLVLLVSALFAVAAWYMISLGEIGLTTGKYHSRRLVAMVDGRDAWFFSLLPLSMSILFYLQFCKMNKSSLAIRAAGTCLIALPPIAYYFHLPM